MLDGAKEGAAMFDIAEQVQRWRASGLPVSLARVISTRGFSSREPLSVLAATPNQPPIGQLFSGAGQERIAQLLSEPRAGARLEEVTVSDEAAVRAGLACGGMARLLIQPAVEIPEPAWMALVDRAPVCLVTRIDGETVGATDAILMSTLDKADDAVRQFFNRGEAGTAVLTTGSGDAFVAAMWPPTALVVVGRGQLAEALVTAARVLGWTGIVVDSAQDAAERCGVASGGDVVVVLSHDLTISGGALRAALASSAGYVGALGSRHTQAARAKWLTAHGVDPAALVRINGPAGLDIGANTPGEVAISILAAAIAARAGAAGGRLADRAGPIHAPARTPE
jgi:xanthine dehydrogenase accessory factor